MGTASFTVSYYGRSRGRSAGSILSSRLHASGAHTTSTTATNLAGTDADGTAWDANMSDGQVLQVYADVAMRVRFGGQPATASTGFYIPAGMQDEIECNNPGTVSIIDVS